MKRMLTSSFLAGLAIIAPGCKKSSTNASGGGGGAGGGGASAPKGLPDALAAWMPKDAAAAFAGTWSGRLMIQTGGSMSMAGAPVAVEIKDGAATAFDGTKDHPLAFAIATPCTADFVESKQEHGGEAKYTYTVQYAVVGGKVQIAEGAVGLRRGKAAVVCTSSMDGMFVLDDKGACQNWAKHFGDEWEAKPATCAWSAKDGKDVLTIGTGDQARVLTADGDVLRSEQFAQSVTEAYWTKTPDLAAAKQLVGWEVQSGDDARNKGKPGTVGDVATIANAAATLGDAAAAKAVDGKPATLTGYVVRTGVTSTDMSFVEIVDERGLRSPSASCYSKTKLDAARWQKVTVAGTLSGSATRVDLHDCTVTKAP
jgi:hypothetical protein